MNKQIFLLLSLFFIFNFTLWSQDFSRLNLPELSHQVETIRTNPKTNQFEYIKFNPNFFLNEVNASSWINALIELDDNFSWIPFNSIEDKLGFKHTRLRMHYKGVPIETYQFILHLKNNLIESINGEYPQFIKSISDDAKISKDRAQELAKLNLSQGFRKECIWRTDNLEPTTTLYIHQNNKLILCHKVDVYSVSPLGRYYVYVDAGTAEIIYKEERIHEADEVGTAETKYSGTQNITTDSFNGGFRLRESGRGQGINTLNLNNGTSYGSATDFVDSDNYWNTTTNQDNAAYDAHLGSEAVYDYFFNNFGRNSFDDQGAPINSYVHYSTDFVNAFWNGSEMTYGDGDNVNYTALTSLDIVAHEISHAVTEYTAGLVYSYESGALNESFSDIFGVAIDFQVNPNSANYFMGDQIQVNGNGFRDMSNPKSKGDPDTYDGENWWTSAADNGGVHTNSGVQNFWFYLLVNGGSGTNDNSDNYVVDGVGMAKANQIVYRNLSVYLSPTSNFMDARNYSIQSAIDLYGVCTPEVEAVTDAWYAVGVGEPYNGNIIADFSANRTFFCSSPANVTFTNNSNPNAINFKWDFGDGNSSIDVNPSHSYSLPGTYSVKLIAYGPSNCSTNDTLTLVDYISVNTSSLTPASCQPETDSPDSRNAGIYEVSLNTLVNTTDNAFSEGYSDYSCLTNTELKEGTYYSLSVTVGNELQENVTAWIDFNNDGVFDNTTEQVLSVMNVTGNFSRNILIPSGAVLNTEIRMRVMSDVNVLLTACQEPSVGQVEDYSVQIIENIDPFVADFSSNKQNLNSGQSVIYQDLSTKFPTSWLWEFEGGTPATSTDQNPTVTYSTQGTFSTKLKVNNGTEIDSITKVDFIVVQDEYYICNETESNGSVGKIYDSGGPDEDYSNNTNCSFLINPTCAENLQMSITLDLEDSYDYITIYDGENNLAPMIGSYTGVNSVSGLTSNSGKFYIVFTTDVWIVRSGFEINWTSQATTTETIADFETQNGQFGAGQSIQFIDLSTPRPASFSWDFGDGGTSALKDPTHTYSAAGDYRVKLISYGCVGSDTIEKTITVEDIVIYNMCGVETSSTAGRGKLFDSGGGTDDYQNDELCGFLIEPECSKNLQINFSEIQIESDYDFLFVYDGENSSAPLLASITGNTAPPTIYSTSGKLYLLFESDGIIVNTGFSLTWESEPNGLAPVADFNAPTSDFTFYDIPLTDQSQNFPNTWNWDFGNGSTSSLQNPIVNYAAPGVYDITLIAGNCFGTNTVTKTIEITENSTLSMCSSQGSSSNSGTLFDSGGQDQNYSNDESCVFIISPQCGGVLTLKVEEIMTEVNFDKLFIYDGMDNTGPLIDELTGTQGIGNVYYSNSGSFYIIFTSDGSITSDGFKLTWNSLFNWEITQTGPLVANSNIDFSINSTNTTTWLWDFGDGTTSQSDAPAHVYTSNGDFTVTCTVEQTNGCVMMISKTIRIGFIGLQELKAGIKLYPNPTSGRVHIDNQSSVEIERILVYNSLGQTVKVISINALLDDIQVDLSEFAHGVYTLKLEFKNGDIKRSEVILKP